MLSLISLSPANVSAEPSPKAKPAKATSQNKSAPPRKPKTKADEENLTAKPARKPAPSKENVGYSEEDRKAIEALTNLNRAQTEVKSAGAMPKPCTACTTASKPEAPAAPQSEEPVRSDKNSRFKSVSEIEAYIGCYVVEKDGAYFKAYQTTYKPLIKAAAREFQVPENLLTCLLMRESRFNKSARSPAGALGLGQFMPITMKFLTKIISKGDKDQETIAELEEVAANASQKFTDRDQAYAEEYLSTYSLAMQWKGYFDRLKSEGKYSGSAPKRFSADGALTPAIAIGASALYLKLMMEFFEADLNPDGKIRTGSVNKPDFDFLVTVGGSYNIGHNAAARMLENVRPPTTLKWRKKLENSNDETGGHIRSIANCLERGSTKPMQGDGAKDCKP